MRVYIHNSLACVRITYHVENSVTGRRLMKETCVDDGGQSRWWFRIVFKVRLRDEADCAWDWNFCLNLIGWRSFLECCGVGDWMAESKFGLFNMTRLYAYLIGCGAQHWIVLGLPDGSRKKSGRNLENRAEPGFKLAAAAFVDLCKLTRLYARQP
jgi:hypothetical protein